MSIKNLSLRRPDHRISTRPADVAEDSRVLIGATLFSELPGAVRSREEPRYEHPRWRVGDRARPRHEWSDGQTPVIPSGEVVRAETFGLGQVVKVGSDPRFYLAGQFERERTP